MQSEFADSSSAHNLSKKPVICLKNDRSNESPFVIQTDLDTSYVFTPGDFSIDAVDTFYDDKSAERKLPVWSDLNTSSPVTSVQFRKIDYLHEDSLTNIKLSSQSNISGTSPVTPVDSFKEVVDSCHDDISTESHFADRSQLDTSLSNIPIESEKVAGDYFQNDILTKTQVDDQLDLDGSSSFTPVDSTMDILSSFSDDYSADKWCPDHSSLKILSSSSFIDVDEPTKKSSAAVSVENRTKDATYSSTQVQSKQVNGMDVSKTLCIYV